MTPGEPVEEVVPTQDPQIGLDPDPNPDATPAVDPGTELIPCGSLRFGGDGYIVVEASDDFPAGNERRTVMFWVRSPVHWGNVFTFGSGMTPNARWSYLLEEGFSKIVGQNNDYSFNDDVGEGWTHIAVVYEDGALRRYTNGVGVGQYGVYPAFDTDGRQDFVIGSNSLDRDDEYLDGDLSDVRVWRRALSADEIVAELVSRRADQSGLVGHWPLNDRSGTRVVDLSGRGHDGVLVGGTWSSACPSVQE